MVRCQNPLSKNRVASVAVNAFVLKTNNEGRNGLIYFKRLKDRSFFNYMNKIIFSGVVTSVGARKNSQYRKKFTNDSYTREDPSRVSYSTVVFAVLLVISSIG